jgi:AcrR family transcriptional regulator
MDKEDRHNLIIECAKELFGTLGYHATSIAKIIEKAEIARGTFYLYFNSKKSVFSEVLDDVTREILESTSAVDVTKIVDRDSVLKQLRINVAHALAPMFRDRNLARIIVSHGNYADSDQFLKIKNFYKYLTEWLSESLEEGIQLKIVRPCNTKIVANAMIGMLKGILWNLAYSDESMDIHEVVEEIVSLASSGIIPPNLKGYIQE